jgi:excisionase family DNA binding protein
VFATAEYNLHLFTPMKTQMQMSIDGSILTVNELADYLKIHRTTVYRLLKKHQLPGFRVGADWRFNRENIDEWCGIVVHPQDN